MIINMCISKYTMRNYWLLFDKLFFLFCFCTAVIMIHACITCSFKVILQRCQFQRCASITRAAKSMISQLHSSCRSDLLFDFFCALVDRIFSFSSFVQDVVDFCIVAWLGAGHSLPFKRAEIKMGSIHQYGFIVIYFPEVIW